MKQIEAIIFDWAGTTVDYGCMAPMHAMQQAFSEHHIPVTFDEIREPMGLLKIDHIKRVLQMERVSNEFTLRHGRKSTEEDIDTIYRSFEKEIFASLHKHTNVINGLLPVQTYLRSQRIKIGSTTGYTQAMINIVADSAKKQGYQPDYIISSDEVQRGRPYPYMLHKNVSALDVQDIRGVIKVGDTVVDILEGLHAGCWSIGVVKGSSMMGISEDEASNLSPIKFNQRAKQVRHQMLAAGADYVIDSIDELPAIIELINQRL